MQSRTNTTSYIFKAEPQRAVQSAGTFMAVATLGIVSFSGTPAVTSNQININNTRDTLANNIILLDQYSYSSLLSKYSAKASQKTKNFTFVKSSKPKNPKITHEYYTSYWG